MFEELLRFIDEQRTQAPWVEWAQKNRVRLHLTGFAPMDTAYVLGPSEFTEGYTVVAHPLGWRQIRALLGGGPLPPSDRALAEMIAWQKCELPEPSDAVARGPREGQG